MAVLLIYNQSNYPPLGALYLCDALEKAGIPCEIYPHTISEEALDIRIRETKPTVVGMSVNTSPQIASFVKHSTFIRDNYPNLKIIWGGPHVSINPEQCASEAFVDHVITGQAEETLPAVVHSLENGETLEQIIHSRPLANLDAFSPRWDKIDITRFLFPQEHSVHSKNRLEHDSEQGLRKQNIFYYFLTSRGCPYKCTFCSESLKAINPKWVAHSSDWFKQEIGNVRNNLSQKGFTLDGIGIWDDMFWINRDRAYAILDYLKSINFGYLIEARADNLIKQDAGLLKKLVDTNCMQVFVGAESANQGTLDYIRKGTKSSDYRKLIDIAEQHNLAIRFSLIVGFPGETDESVNATLDFADEVKTRRNAYASISGPKLFTPYPGTAEFERAVHQGFAPPKTTVEWAGINRHSENYIEIFPWLRKNLSPQTIERLHSVFEEMDAK